MWAVKIVLLPRSHNETDSDCQATSWNLLTSGWKWKKRTSTSTYPIDQYKFMQLGCSMKAVMYSVSQKKSPWGYLNFFNFFSQMVKNFYRFFTRLLYLPMTARLQIIIQLSPTLSKLCHIKRDYLVHIICAKCPKRAKTRAIQRLRKSLIALLIVVCGKWQSL